MRSPWGRVLKSIREDEDAARSLGKNVFSYKMQSLVVGGIIGALGGAVIAVGNRAAQPGNYSTTLTFFAYTILILGGVARVKGPIIGAMIFWFTITFVDNVLAEAVRTDSVPGWLPNWLEVNNSNFGQVKFIIAGIGAGRCWWCSGRRASSATAGSRRSMSADPDRQPTADGVPRRGRPSGGLPFERGVAKPDPILVADGVHRQYGGLIAVDVDHVEIQRGLITALIGPNGAGKSTFFNLLTGFDEPDHGRWTFDGQDVTGKSGYKLARAGMVRTFQLTKSLTRLSVIENMKLGAQHQTRRALLVEPAAAGLARQEKEIEARADGLLERFRLDHMRDEYAG